MEFATAIIAKNEREALLASPPISKKKGSTCCQARRWTMSFPTTMVLSNENFVLTVVQHCFGIQNRSRAWWVLPVDVLSKIHFQNLNLLLTTQDAVIGFLSLKILELGLTQGIFRMHSNRWRLNFLRVLVGLKTMRCLTNEYYRLTNAER